MRRALVHVRGDHRVHVPYGVNALPLVADTPLDDLANVHDDLVPDLQTWKPGVFFAAVREQGGMGIAAPVISVRLIRALDVAVAEIIRPPR